MRLHSANTVYKIFCENYTIVPRETVFTILTKNMAVCKFYMSTAPTKRLYRKENYTIFLNSKSMKFIMH